jgi:predicted metalloprotease with PDZ domain
VKFRYALLVSFALHAAADKALDLYIEYRIKEALLAMLEGGAGKKSASDSSRYTGVADRDIPPRLQPTEVEIVVREKGPGPKPKKKIDTDCPRGYYEGVGMESEGRNGKEIVSAVFIGYPAFKADIRPGDEIVRISDKTIPGPKGTAVVMYMQRDGITTIKTVIRDKICY